MAETHPLRTNDQIPTTKSFQQYNAQAEQLAKSCSMATVPSLTHLKSADYNVVYEPSDDTFLMLDALKHEFDTHGFVKQLMNDTTTNSGGDDASLTSLEIGCGTGVNSIYLAQLLLSSSTSSNKKDKTQRLYHHVTDINQDAIRITMATAQQNNLPPPQPPKNNNNIDENTETNSNNNHTIMQIIPHHCDLATPLLETHTRTIDILLFNPPYVPTPDEEVGSNTIEASWAGGTDGRVVLDRALPQIAQLLSYPYGVAYVITVDDNMPEEIQDVMKKEYGMSVIPLVRRKARNEYLSVLKFSWIILSPPPKISNDDMKRSSVERRG